MLSGRCAQFRNDQSTRSAKLLLLPVVPEISRGTRIPLRMKQCTCRFHWSDPFGRVFSNDSVDMPV